MDLSLRSEIVGLVALESGSPFSSIRVGRPIKDDSG